MRSVARIAAAWRALEGRIGTRRRAAGGEGLAAAGSGHRVERESRREWEQRRPISARPRLGARSEQRALDADAPGLRGTTLRRSVEE